MHRSTSPLSGLALALALAGCADPGTSPGDDDDSTGSEECSYPAGAAEPMALNEVLFPYSWPSAFPFDSDEVSLSLERTFCNEDDIDWSPFDVLLFVSFPAW